MSLARSTIKDVALAARVTAGTVSRALRGDPRVIETTRQRILEAAQSLDYRPNLQARGLQTGRTGTVGLASAAGSSILLDPRFASLHAGFTAEASKDGVKVLLYLSPEEGGQACDANNVQARELLDGRVDGGFIYQAQDFSPETLHGLQRRGVPVVLMGADDEIPGFFQVLAGTEQRIRESLDWAHELGARRVCILGLGEGAPFNDALARAAAARLPLAATVHAVRGRGCPIEGMDAAMASMVAERPDAVVFNSEFHVGHFLRRQQEGSLPRGLHLFSHGSSGKAALMAFPGVRYLETDLWAAGGRAYLMFKDAQERKAPRSEGLVWIRRN